MSKKLSHINKLRFGSVSRFMDYGVFVNFYQDAKFKWKSGLVHESKIPVPYSWGNFDVDVHWSVGSTVLVRVIKEYSDDRLTLGLNDIPSDAYEKATEILKDQYGTLLFNGKVVSINNKNVNVSIGDLKCFICSDLNDDCSSALKIGDDVKVEIIGYDRKTQSLIAEFYEENVTSGTIDLICENGIVIKIEDGASYVVPFEKLRKWYPQLRKVLTIGQRIKRIVKNKDSDSSTIDVRDDLFEKFIPNFVAKNIILVGATGAGKSSLINQIRKSFLFELDKTAKVGDIEPTTQEITAFDCYCSTLFDTPGLGESEEKDKNHYEKISHLIEQCTKEKTQILVILDAMTRDYGTTFDLIKRLSDEYGQSVNFKFILNKIDGLFRPGFMNFVLSNPNNRLSSLAKKRVKDKASSVKDRIRCTTNIKTDVICVAAGHEEQAPLCMQMLLEELQK